MPYKYSQDKKAYHKEYHKQWYSNNREQQKLRMSERRKELRDWFNNIKLSSKCSICGENHIACLDFHHTDPSTKDFDISLMVSNGLSREKILVEISKCIVLCTNCHRKLHYEEKWEYQESNLD